jgi:hypothetical protein
LNGYSARLPVGNVVWFALDEPTSSPSLGIWTELKGDRGDEIQTGTRPAPNLRFPNDGTECGC